MHLAIALQGIMDGQQVRARKALPRQAASLGDQITTEPDIIAHALTLQGTRSMMSHENVGGDELYVWVIMLVNE